MKTFLLELVNEIVLTFAIWILSTLAKYIISKTKQEPTIETDITLKKLKQVRIQFFVFLILSVLSFIASLGFRSEEIKILTKFLFGFSLLVVWGAFDELYYQLKKLHDNDSQNISNKRS